MDLIILVLRKKILIINMYMICKNIKALWPVSSHTWKDRKVQERETGRVRWRTAIKPLFLISYGYFTVYHVRVPNIHFPIYSKANGLVYSIWINLIWKENILVEWSRALDVRLSEWCCSVTMVWVQIPSRGEQTKKNKKKNLTALKSNSNTVWFNFQYIYYRKAKKVKNLFGNENNIIMKKTFKQK